MRYYKRKQKRDMSSKTIDYNDTNPDEPQLLGIIKKGAPRNNQVTCCYTITMTIIKYILAKTKLGVVKTRLSN
jgi:hypothetical protein